MDPFPAPSGQLASTEKPSYIIVHPEQLSLVRGRVSSSRTSFWTLPTIKSAVSNFLDTANLTVGSVQKLFLVCETHRRAEQFTVADPGFPRGGGANSPVGMDFNIRF